MRKIILLTLIALLSITTGCVPSYQSLMEDVVAYNKGPKRVFNTFDLHHLIEYHSARYGIPPAFSAAIAYIESNYNSCAVSHMNAQGIMQLMPQTAKALGVSDPYDPVQGMQGGIAYLAEAYQRTNGDLSLSAAYYNAGPKALRLGANRWPRETQNYIRKLVKIWPRFQGERWRQQVPKTITRTNRLLCSYTASK